MTKEWEIGKHRAWWDDEKQVLYLSINGEYCGAEHREYLNIYSEAFKGVDKWYALIDLSNARPLDKETRHAMKEEESKIAKGTDKLAFVGASPSLRMMAKIVMKLSRHTSAAFFRSEEEALEWFNT